MKQVIEIIGMILIFLLLMVLLWLLNVGALAGGLAGVTYMINDLSSMIQNYNWR